MRLAPAIIALCAVLLCRPVPCGGQTFDEELARLIDIVLLPRGAETHRAKSPAGAVVPGFSIEKAMLTGPIKFYQVAVSSQDMSICNYYPSCSRFGEQAIKKAGALRGLLLTSDRLQRCNGIALYPEAYKYDRVRQKFIDPLERYTEKDRACSEAH